MPLSAAGPTVQSAGSAVTALSPKIRWIKARQFGISKLEIVSLCRACCTFAPPHDGYALSVHLQTGSS
ncbi:hypothetical protein WJX73_003821 [Symbiochloris irregularis]|uniref:Uncharacterized protein n=1 Tax=Symbiochloris irregularis TaxID=706552 RepID=A0AAW1P8H5_9CHLO